MRLVGFAVLVSSSIAVAQPPPPPPPVPAPEVEQPKEGSSFGLRAGIGFGRYIESGVGWKWQSELQPFAQVGADLAIPAGRGWFVLQAQAGFGSDTHMSASGQLMQENQFHQQIFEASPRYRHPFANSRFYFEGGYRLTIQRLFFTDIPMLGDARETVTVHALEGGFGWRKQNLSGGEHHFALTIGLNRGSAENSRVTGEDFSAGGFSLDTRVGHRWASGFGIAAHLAYRKQNGSKVATVNFDGMETQAQWPDNETWQLLGVIGFKI